MLLLFVSLPLFAAEPKPLPALIKDASGALEAAREEGGTVAVVARAAASGDLAGTKGIVIVNEQWKGETIEFTRDASGKWVAAFGDMWIT